MQQLELHAPISALPALEDAWGLLEGLIEKEDSLFTRDEIEHNLCYDLMQLWTVTDERGVAAVAVTQFQQFGDILICAVILLGGRGMSNWIHHMDDLEAWALSRGASRMKIHGRDGWERRLSGYRKTSIVLSKELRHVVER
jgi:hypothetical protein